MKSFHLYFSKEADYHIHTNFINHADNEMSISNIVSEARQKGLKTIAITEHIRKDSTWANKYLEEIANTKSEITIIPGFEAKVLNKKGELDILNKYTKNYLVIGSFHTFSDPNDFYEATLNLTKNPKVDIIGHFGFCNDFIMNLTEEQENTIINSIKKNNKIVEINSKYSLPQKDFVIKLIKAGVNLCYGSDSHSLKEIGVIKWNPLK